MFASLRCGGCVVLWLCGCVVVCVGLLWWCELVVCVRCVLCVVCESCWCGCVRFGRVGVDSVVCVSVCLYISLDLWCVCEDVQVCTHVWSAHCCS